MSITCAWRTVTGEAKPPPRRRSERSQARSLARKTPHEHLGRPSHAYPPSTHELRLTIMRDGALDYKHVGLARDLPCPALASIVRPTSDERRRDYKLLL
jgi:hypothetical protein